MAMRDGIQRAYYVLQLIGWGGTEVPAALRGCVQYGGHLREGMINHVILHTVQRLG